MQSSSIRRAGSDSDATRDAGKDPQKIDRLFAAAKARFEKLILEGHTERLERCVAMMHLAATYIFAVPQEDRPARMREISACVERAYAAGCNDVNEPVDLDSALAFVVSYPRSGNTVLI